MHRLTGFTCIAATLVATGPATADPAPREHSVTVTPATSEADIANPERGFYHVLSGDLAAADEGEMSRAFAAGDRLLYVRIDLAPYRQSPLSPAFLARLDSGFAAARRSGVKLIVRATYNNPHGETDYHNAQDAPLPRVLGHLAQLKPLWHRNADVIAYVQAGFVGAWGEWHSSSNGLAAPAARNRIKDALLDAVPASRSVQFRYPPYLIAWAPVLPAAGTKPAGRFRLGFHNDCFLASRTDVGTFDENPARRRAQQAYIDRLGDVAPVGGETCNPADDPAATPRTGCAAILADGARYNLSFLNAGYYRPIFHDRWQAEGCMDEVRRRLGYRLSLVQLSYPRVVARGTPLEVAAVIRNAGWARMANPRAVSLLLRNRTDGAVRRITAQGADPRDWLPGADATARLRAMIPADLAPGRYDLLLALPDADPRLAGDPRYAVRLANGDDAARGQGWDAALGAYAPGAVLTVR